MNLFVVQVFALMQAPKIFDMRSQTILSWNLLSCCKLNALESVASTCNAIDI